MHLGVKEICLLLTTSLFFLNFLKMYEKTLMKAIFSEYICFFPGGSETVSTDVVDWYIFFYIQIHYMSIFLRTWEKWTFFELYTGFLASSNTINLRERSFIQTNKGHWKGRIKCDPNLVKGSKNELKVQVHSRGEHPKKHIFGMKCQENIM